VTTCPALIPPRIKPSNPLGRGTSHEAPYVLDGLLHHGTALRIGTHYTDTGGASDHVFILCTMLGFRFCPRLRDFPDRKRSFAGQLPRRVASFSEDEDEAPAAADGRGTAGTSWHPARCRRHGALLTLSRADQNLVGQRRRDANRIGFAVQLALLRHPGIALAQLEQPVEPLVQWLARQLELPAAPFADYARRPQTMTDHARLLATALDLRPAANTDLPMMIEATAQAAWGTDRGQPIAAAVVTALRAAGTILPASSVIERTAIAGRARARKRGRTLCSRKSPASRWSSSIGCS
jgi:hypothetical protein